MTRPRKMADSDGLVVDVARAKRSRRRSGPRRRPRGDMVVRAVRRSTGEGRAVGVFSAMDGLGRYARACCGVEPLVLCQAWRLLAADPVPEVRAQYPKAKVDEAQAEGWHRSFAGAWARHAEAW